MSEQIYQQALQEFAPLPLNEKKNKLLELVNSFKDAHPVFKEIREDIQALNYTDAQYIEIYKIILKSVYQVEKNESMKE